MFKCPRCGCKHNWPTEDHLCYKCEGEWVDEYMENPEFYFKERQ